MARIWRGNGANRPITQTDPPPLVSRSHMIGAEMARKWRAYGADLARKWRGSPSNPSVAHFLGFSWQDRQIDTTLQTPYSAKASTRILFCEADTGSRREGEA